MATESSSVKRILWFSLITLLCSAARGQGVGGNGVPGAGSGGGASIPATSNVLKGAGSAGAATAATPGTDYMAGVPAPGSGYVPVSTGAGGAYSAQALTYTTVGASPGVTPATFGGFGDAYSPPNGCSTTPSSTTVVCPDGPFVSTDVGKQMWISKAGAAGAAFHATITAVSSNTTVTVSSAVTGTVTNGRAIYGHDDTTAVQACFQYSALNGAQCVLKPVPPVGLGLAGFLIGTGGLTLVSNNYLEENSGPNIVGNSQVNGTNLFCEFNGDCISLAAGPIQGVNLSNLSIEEDASQPNSRGLHFNPQTGTFGNGPFTNSNITNVTVDNPALECLWMDGGGGPGYTYNLPNQYLNFYQFFCNGPNQSHPANLMLMTGQAAQIAFFGGQVNGQDWTGAGSPLYPNPMIKITEKTPTLGDTPVDVKFFGFTFEVGTQGLYIGNGANNIHFDNGYVENVGTPFLVTGAVANTFNGNHIANSGNTTAVYQFASSSGGSIRDNLVYGGSTPAAFAICTGNNAVEFSNNNSSVTTTTGCVTTAVSPSTSTLSVLGGSSVSVAASGNPITTISAPGVNAGKTLTLYASGTFALASGGNISFGGLPSPLVIPAGQSVTLTLFDSGPTWVITSTTAWTGTIPSQNSTFFDDFYTGANMANDPIGSPTGSSCSPNNTYTDNNHPGNMLLTAGTAGTGTGIVCGLVSEANSITSANTSQGWTWETAVYVPVLPGTTAGAYQAGMAHTPNASPWTTGIGFYLSSANGVVNDWYCRYNSTSTDSGVAATVAWTRLTMVNDGTNVHWYIGGTQVCGTGVAIGSMPSTTQYPAVWSATALSATSVTMAYDYINWQRAVSR
jgi:hypothetical protein